MKNLVFHLFYILYKDKYIHNFISYWFLNPIKPTLIS